MASSGTPKILVTQNNISWAAALTGKRPEEVAHEFNKAHGLGEVCVMTVHPSRQHLIEYKGEPMPAKLYDVEIKYGDELDNSYTMQIEARLTEESKAWVLMNADYILKSTGLTWDEFLIELNKEGRLMVDLQARAMRGYLDRFGG